MTVSVAGWLFTEPALAMMVTVPGATPVASPLASMVAVPEKLQNQAKVTFGTGFPLASIATAENCCVLPTATVVDIGEITTLAIRVVTVKVTALLVMFEAAAVIWVVPLVNPVALPAVSTVAMAGALLVHVSMRLGTELPLASVGTAKKVCFWPA